MGKLVWDKLGEHFYETGVRNGVLYPQSTSGAYPKGVAWNGLSAVTESPSGAEANPIYADDIKYLNLYSAEELGLTIEAFTYPEEFEECDGSGALDDALNGVIIGQQSRKAFGFCYRTIVGNDVLGNDLGYKLHLVYGCKASPSERAHNTVNDSPEATTFSWEVSTTPVALADGRTTVQVTIDSTKVTKSQLEALEAVLFGTDDGEGTTGTDPRLPLPDEIATILKNAPAG